MRTQIRDDDTDQGWQGKQFRDGYRLGMQRTQISDEDIYQGCKGHRLAMRTQMDVSQGCKGHRLVMETDWNGRDIDQ